jgi:uncharacterized membrane protein
MVGACEDATMKELSRFVTLVIFIALFFLATAPRSEAQTKKAWALKHSR